MWPLRKILVWGGRLAGPILLIMFVAASIAHVVKPWNPALEFLGPYPDHAVIVTGFRGGDVPAAHRKYVLVHPSTLESITMTVFESEEGTKHVVYSGGLWGVVASFIILVGITVVSWRVSAT